MNRRGFLTGLLAAPAVITTPGLLMPVRAWAEPFMFENCVFNFTHEYSRHHALMRLFEMSAPYVDLD